VWLREEMRDLSSRMYHLLRRCVLNIAARRGLGDDVFFMSFREIFADDRSQIERNREIYDSYRNFKALNEIGASYEVVAKTASPGALVGLSACAGTAGGPAFVASCLSSAASMSPGQILVCPFTDPGWTPVLSRASAVVTETGGLLSHAAVICREFGIPAVLGVEGATNRIRHGEQIRVDGNLGSVHFETSASERSVTTW
jgi:pyruvate,water dikinase